MPQNLILTQPDAVMPQGLMSAFSEEIERPALADGVWSLGESVRFPLTLQARRVFRLARRLDAIELDQLRSFLLNKKNQPFWFYNLRETQPIGSYDPTGQNPIGRYAVVWQGGMSSTIEPGGLAPATGKHGRNGTISIELREVAI